MASRMTFTLDAAGLKPLPRLTTKARCGVRGPDSLGIQDSGKTMGKMAGIYMAAKAESEHLHGTHTY